MTNPGTNPAAAEDRGKARELGRDGVSGLVTRDRGMRAREVSVPTDDDHANAAKVLDALLARADGRRHR